MYSNESLNNGAVLSVGGGGAGGPAGNDGTTAATNGGDGGDSIFNPNDGSAITITAEGGEGSLYAIKGQARAGGNGGDGTISNGYTYKNGGKGEDGIIQTTLPYQYEFLPGKTGYLTSNCRSGLDSELSGCISSQGLEGDQTTFFGQYIGSGDHVGQPWGFGAVGVQDRNESNEGNYWNAGESGRDGVVVIVEYK
tara:strand:- start:622 stop:1206 length:585 start_codon:yes stop_codon:yes gene_type:complete